jgi:hypothetical protein
LNSYHNPKGLILKIPILLAFATACFGWQANAQISFAPYEALFTTPKRHVVTYATQPPLIDGNIKEKAWDDAAWTDVFTDIEGDIKPQPQYETKVKMLYSDTFLFVAAQLEEPHVWATLKKRDAIIYHDNDFEVFINPSGSGHQYYEIEINALNTILDLFLSKPYRNGAGALIGYDLNGLKSAVQVQGTINNAGDQDSGWTIEMAIPFRQLFAGNTWKTPDEGALWRINFSRVQWDTDIKEGSYLRRRDNNGKLLPEHNWVWSPQGVINMHYPERWGYLQFTRNGESKAQFDLPYNEKRSPYLWLVYYRQKAYLQKHGKYATSLQELSMPVDKVLVNGQQNKLRIEATNRQFSVYIQDQNTAVSLNDEGLVQQTKPL